MALTRPYVVTSSSDDESEYMTDNEAEEQKEDRKNTNKADREEEEEEGEFEEDDEEEFEKDEEEGHLNKRPSVLKPNPTRIDEGFDSESDSLPEDPTLIVAASKPAVKRPAETEQNWMESRTKKKKVSNGDDETGAIEERKSAFSRLWSEDDEIAILKGMIDYKSNKGADPYTDMGAFHVFIKKSLHVDVSKNQLTDKIKRLKKKYRNNAEKGENPVFSKPHEHKSFELSKKIWGAVATPSKGMDDNPRSTNRKATKNSTINHSLSLLKEEKHELGIKVSQEVFLSMYPRLNESLQSENGLYLSLSESGRNFLKERMSLIGSAKAEKLEEKWNNLQVDEIEIYLKRVELIREQTTLALAAMKSSKS